MKNSLHENILATIIYYDVLDYPLTSFEIWKYLVKINSAEEIGKKIDLFSITKTLEEEEIKKHISENYGFYFLRGRESLAQTRIERNKISQRKLKLIRRIARVLSFVPFVRMVAVSGRVAMKNAEDRSDLDLLIVLKEGRIFTGRLLVTLAVHLIGKRRYEKKITDRACLNYYVTTASLEIELKDIYSSTEYSFLFPIFGAETFRRFQEENHWITNFKPNFSSDKTPSLGRVLDFFEVKMIREAMEKILDFDSLENFLKKIQMKRIMSDPRTYQKGSAVMASDRSLVFLPLPHGPKVYDKFREKLDQLRV